MRQTYFYSYEIKKPWYKQRVIGHGTINLESKHLWNIHESINHLHTSVAKELGCDSFKLVLISAIKI